MSRSATTYPYWLTALALLALLGGCSLVGVGSSEFTCETSAAKNATGDSAAVCGGVRAVYKATNTKDHIDSPLKVVKPSVESPPATAKNYTNAPESLAASTSTMAPPLAPIVTVVLPPPVTAPKPIMEPAQVARIWINYWIDTSGDLHQPGLIYTEITPRRWAIGQPANLTTRDIQPLQAVRGAGSSNVVGPASPLVTTDQAVNAQPTGAVLPFTASTPPRR